MTHHLEDYRYKLITKILFSDTQEEVIRFCNAAVKGLEQDKVNAHMMVRFADKVISELELFDPMDKDAQQWSNIRMARIQFRRIKQQLSASVN